MATVHDGDESDHLDHPHWGDVCMVGTWREPTEEQIAASRARLGIPQDWAWSPCQADCGDLVWHPAEVAGTGAVLVCSSACALVLVERLGLS